MKPLLGFERGRLASVAAAAAIVLAGAFSAAPAHALNFYQNYFVEPTYDIRSIVFLQYTGGGGGSTNSFDAFAPSTLITDPFLKTEAITDTYFLGVSDFGDSESGEDHLVLALDDGYAAGLLGFDFTDLFPAFDEGELIAALDLLNTPDNDNAAEKDAAYDLIGSFSDQVRGNGGTFGSVDTFSLVGFSTASAVGVGESSITVVPVPEPATWALLITGFGGAGAMLRRRRAKDTFVAA
ncbi:MAG: PEP-CTERM sorting domain-containing protein [Phenylobacterium sp.]|uniref:PEPxxWA-CTERM sorting domain-containing protein n=1 Tax=Phenylobacterium sp. TaxID=1871053 RepID=UPI0011FE480E|nr:PEPxxWA-CTERM sorting domain-containing protein [Phenylobacterium sp.]TAJ70794.1 MAG: PEP-CTERM sorting domain-containing protein [Phenylobacterium sp.]